MDTAAPGHRNLSVDALAAAARLILDCGDDFAAMKQAAERMYAIYSALSGITADDCTTGTIMLPSGKAIAPGAAAHCLLEFRRTAIFLRGIRLAIEQVRRDNTSGPVRILYAGCGPYATLLTPLFTQFASSELRADLLEINPVALNSTQTIIEALGLHGFVTAYLLADASNHRLGAGADYDILLTETMQACLDNEPQVAILHNLLPQLRDDVLVIPQEIVIDARLIDPRQEMASFFHAEPPPPPPERICLGEVLRLTRDCPVPERFARVVNMPAEIAGCAMLNLFTTVRVFADEVLRAYDTSITLPKKYHDCRELHPRQARFWYDREGTPGMRCQVED